MTNPDLRLDEPIAGDAIPTAEDLANLAESRATFDSLAPELADLILVKTATGWKPINSATDQELLSLLVQGRIERAYRKLIAETDAEDAAGIRGECLGPDPTVQRLEYADWHPAL
jgi:hypothetical protein